MPRLCARRWPWRCSRWRCCWARLGPSSRPISGWRYSRHLSSARAWRDVSMTPDRRRLLAGAGAALVLGGIGFRAWDRGVWSGGEGAAYAPWLNLEASASDHIMRPLHAAILAANPHDTQPWLFQIRNDSITLFADRSRHLGSFDPFRREMHLGLGAALENLALAAGAFGFSASIIPVEGRLSLSPDNAPTVAARIVLRSMP